MTTRPLLSPAQALPLLNDDEANLVRLVNAAVIEVNARVKAAEATRHPAIRGYHLDVACQLIARLRRIAELRPFLVLGRLGLVEAKIARLRAEIGLAPVRPVRPQTSRPSPLAGVAHGAFDDLAG